jgi:acetyl esterase/lipase
MRFRDEVFPRVAVDHGLPYGEAPGLDGRPQRLLLDLYRPRGDQRTRRPAMVWVHGGGFAKGSRRQDALRGLARGSARRGFVAVSIDYRILMDHTCSVEREAACRGASRADQHDVQAAVRWLRRHARRYRIDPNRIAVGGTSVGGLLSYMVGTRPEDPGDSGNPGWSSAVNCFVSIAGGYPKGGGFATAGDAPGLFFHGTHDRVVPLRWSAEAAEALQGAGVPAIFERIPRGQHVAYQVFHERYDTHTAWFLYRQLRLRPPR